MKLLSFFKRIRPPRKTHDYTVRKQGHDFAVMNVGGYRISIYGWGRGISAGDYIILPNKVGTTRYRFDRITYFEDPPDMWSGEAVFCPRILS